MNPLVELQKFGQSFWYDNIRRGLIQSGELKKMIVEDGLRGVTSNPTIFEKAISASTDYDDAIRELVAKKKSVPDIFDALSVKDIQMASDLFRPLYDETGGADGFVSIEVAPQYGRDTEKTVSEARRLWKLVNRPNLMVKIPATKEGLPAIEKCLAEGININITLIFSIERYEQVMDAYISALEKRAKDGEPVDRVASVASFFVSRIDSSVDKLLQDRIQSSQNPKEKDLLLELLGKIAVANAKMAYQAYKKIFTSPRFETLRKKGARVQRPLWASTGTKNPNYSDALYIEELIGPDTVNTMPPATISAFRDHGKPRASLEENLPAAREALEKLKGAGIDLKKITVQLEQEGLKSFSDSFEKLMQCLTAKKEMLLAGQLARQSLRLGRHEAAVKSALEKLEKEKAAERLWSRDASLWKGDAAAIRNRLGWLDAPAAMSEHAASLTPFAADLRKAGFSHAVLLGMGGSSLCAEVLKQTFGRQKDGLALHVLDTTDPGWILSVEKSVDLPRTLFLVSSKSGGTIEVLSLFRYFYAKMQAVKKDKAGENFAAITDPGTVLEKLAHEKRFRKVFSAPADVGGRYSALTYFGLVPAALLGLDVRALLDRADRMATGCASCVPARDNPGVELGAALGALAAAGRDKLTFFLSPEISSLGLWLEQLIAESTGKEGKGIVPVDGEEPAGPEAYGADRVFAHLKLSSSADAGLDDKLRALEEAGHPVIQIVLNDAYDLAQEFFRWETATAVAGAVLGVNPFDEPNVAESKANTAKVLERFAADGRLPQQPPLGQEDGLAVWAAEGTGKSPADILRAHAAQARPGGYVAFLAYANPTPAFQKALQRLRHMVRGQTRVATTVGYGPRFLHSTGQLHKGGSSQGVFVQLTVDDKDDLPIPEARYGFSVLKQAQAAGDFQALRERDRPIVRLHLSGDPVQGLEKLAQSLEKAKASA
jgi:transaldolase / glucose-6-phosphate isomerase